MWPQLPETLAHCAALVVLLHGWRQWAAGCAAGAGRIALAERCGLALLCPEQTRANNPDLCFDWLKAQDIARGGGEAASMVRMVGFALAKHHLDPQRVFVTGL